MKEQNNSDKTYLSRFDNKEFIPCCELMTILGYEEQSPFDEVIEKVKLSMSSLNIEISKHIIPANDFSDVKLSKFACYLAAMNADAEKKEVAKAQAFLASQCSALERCLHPRAHDVSRLDYAKSIFDTVLEEEKRKTKGIS